MIKWDHGGGGEELGFQKKLRGWFVSFWTFLEVKIMLKYLGLVCKRFFLFFLNW